MYNEDGETYDEYIENLKKRTLKIVYQLRPLNPYEPIECETTLIEVMGAEVLELNEAISADRNAPVIKWRDSDDVILIWGKLESRVPIDESDVFTKDDIAFVQEALNGCEHSQYELKIHALLFILGQPFLNYCGTIFCSDIEFKKESQQYFKKHGHELKALVHQ